MTAIPYPQSAELCCIQCRQPLAEIPSMGEESTCTHCGAPLINREGVLDCFPAQQPAEETPSRLDMTQINHDAAEHGWFAAIIEHFRGALHKIAYISDPVRLGWLFHCYDEKANDVCLCLGSDWGAQAFPLTRFYKTVYSVDTSLESLRFQAIRAGAEKVNNLYILRTPPNSLPLADGSVDLVVLSGLLEWLGQSESTRAPQEMQLAVLAEAKRVLKPGGRLYLGIENRLGVHYLLGAKDHSGLAFTSLMPRRLADWWVRRSGRLNGRPSGGAAADKGYRTYTYSAWGYQKLLRRAGFDHSDAYWAWPSYSYPRMSGPLDGRSVRYMTEKMAFQAASRPVRVLARLALYTPHRLLGILIRLLAPHFLIVAGSATDNSSVQAQITQRTPPPHSFVRLTMGINAQVKTTFLLMDKQNDIYKAVRVVEMPTTGPDPAPLLVEETEGIQGRPLRPHVHDDVSAAGLWLADYHKRTRGDGWEAALLIDEIGALAESADPLLEDENHRALLTAFTVRYAQAVQDRPLPRSGEHGDYTLPNILVVENEGKNALRVIDWEFSQVQGNPLMDVGSFMLSLLRRQMRGGHFSASLDEQTPVAWFLNAYNSADKVDALPYHLAPGYYLLRVLDRIRQQPVSPAISHLLLAQWTPLLRPALAFGIAAKGVGEKRVSSIFHRILNRS